MVVKSNSFSIHAFLVICVRDSSPDPPWTATVIGCVISKGASITDAVSQLIAWRQRRARGAGARPLLEDASLSSCILKLLSTRYLLGDIFHKYLIPISGAMELKVNTKGWTCRKCLEKKKRQKNKKSSSKILLCLLAKRRESQLLSGMLFRCSYSSQMWLNNQNSTHTTADIIQS